MKKMICFLMMLYAVSVFGATEYDAVLVPKGTDPSTYFNYGITNGSTNVTLSGILSGNGGGLTNFSITNMAYVPSFCTWVGQTQSLALGTGTHTKILYSNVLWDTASGFVSISNCYKIVTPVGSLWDIKAFTFVAGGTNGSASYMNVRSKGGSFPTNSMDGNIEGFGSLSGMNDTIAVNTFTLYVTNNPLYIWCEGYSISDTNIIVNSYGISVYSRFEGTLKSMR